MLQTEVTVFEIRHYDMDGGNRGVSARILGSFEETNNKFGRSVSEAAIPNFYELEYLKRFKDKLPAKFTCVAEFKTIKGPNGKEMTGLALAELKFKNSVELIDQVQK